VVAVENFSGSDLREVFSAGLEATALRQAGCPPLRRSRNHARAAGHGGNEAQSIRPAAHRQRRLRHAADAADFDAGAHFSLRLAA
jgi:hypothetical protein